MIKKILLSITLVMLAFLVSCDNKTDETNKSKNNILNEHYYLEDKCYFESTFYLNNKSMNRIAIPIATDFLLGEIFSVKFYEDGKEVLSSDKTYLSLCKEKTNEIWYSLLIDVDLILEEQKADKIKIYLDNDILIYNINVRLLTNHYFSRVFLILVVFNLPKNEKML